MRRTILLICLFCGTISLRANEGLPSSVQHSYNLIAEDIPLPHNFIDDLVKDSQGYLWVATHNGLARYDGHKYITFNTSTSPVTLKGDFVRKVCEDNFNRLWVASEGGIDIIDLEQYRNAAVAVTQYSQLWNFMNTQTTSIYKDLKGNMWISTAHMLYYVELDENGVITNYYYLDKDISSSPINAVIDMGWAVCAGIGNTIYHIEKRSNNALKAVPVYHLDTSPYDDLNIHSFEKDGKWLWVSTNRGLYRYDHFSQNIRSYPKAKSDALNQAQITDVKLNGQGKLFVATLNGLNIYDRDKDSFFPIHDTNDGRRQSLNGNYINCILPDGNRLWVGTEMGGINLLTVGRLSTSTWRNDGQNKHSLSPYPVNSVCEDRDGNLWVGTVDGSLNFKRKGSSDFESFPLDESNQSALSYKNLYGMLIDSDNNLWAYTWGSGVSRLDLNIPGNRRFEHYYRGKTQGMEGNFVACACEDKINHGIWFGTTEGLLFYDKLTKKFTQVRFRLPDNLFDYMGALYMDNKYRLWVGSSKGVFVIDIFSFARSRRHFDYMHLNHKLSDPKTNKPDIINCIYQDAEGTVWLGSNGNGLYKLEEETGSGMRFSNFTVKDGLPNNNIIGIVEDRYGYLWMSTDMGISRLDKGSMTYSNYNKYDGLLTNQFFRNAYYYSKSSGLIYFGNTDGLVAISPEITGNTDKPAKVVMTSLNISGSDIYPSSGDYLNCNISCASDIFLHESDKSVTVNFSTQNYDYSSTTRYAYRLKGYEKTWNELEVNEYSAKYTSIPSGNYTFQVRATDSNGRWSDEVTELGVHVKPYFYKSWWFTTLMVIFFLLCIRLFYTWKMRSYKRQKQVLEQTVQERTSELAVQNKRLLEMSRRLANTTEEKIAFFTNITHEFRTTVTLIRGPLEQALKQCGDAATSEQLQLASRSAKYLLTLVNELMDFRKIDSNKVELEMTSGNFRMFMDNTLLPFHAYTKDRNISLNKHFRLDTDYLVMDYEGMRKVIINLVSNAIKFTPNNGKVDVFAATVTDEKNRKLLYISVCDNGSGIAEEDIEKIFDRFYQSKKSVTYSIDGQSSTGIGLYLCRQIVGMHGGNIAAVNNKGKGSSLRVLMPHTEGTPAAEETALQTAVRTEDATDRSKRPKRKTILIVDDNADMRTYIRTLLEPSYNTLEADNGATALEVILSKPVDLILSDLMMPVMNGLELSRQVKANISISHIPLLILTAIVSEVQKKESFEIGVDEYLCKPFDEEILLLRIRNIFDMQQKYKSTFAVSMDSDSLNIAEESKDKVFVSKAIELMKEHYEDSGYEVDNFVRDMGYSKTLVNKKMRELVGQSIGQFMRNYRLNVAREILMKSPAANDRTISEIAYAVGFNDPKYFTKCFREFYGVLPSTIQAQNPA